MSTTKKNPLETRPQSAGGSLVTTPMSAKMLAFGGGIRSGGVAVTADELVMPPPEPAPRTSSVVWHGKGETGSCKRKRSKAERKKRRAKRRRNGRR